MVCGLAWRCRASRSVKNACRVGARVLTGHLPGVLPAVARPGPSAPARRTGTSRCAAGRCGPDRSTACGIRAGMSAPSRYQPSTVATAKECRRSCIRGRQDAERRVSPARSASRAKVRLMLLCSSRVPAVETSSAGLAGKWLGLPRGARHSGPGPAPCWGAAAPGGACRTWRRAPRSSSRSTSRSVVVKADRLTDPDPGDRQQADQGLVGRRPQSPAAARPPP